MIGVGYRRDLAGWIDSRPKGVECLEITAEHFFKGDEGRLEQLGKHFRLLVHGLGLSLGTPGPMDAGTLDQFRRVVHAANPEWISDHIAFTRTSEGNLGHLNPVPPTPEMLNIIADHAREVSESCGRPIILENITSHVRLGGSLSETDFLNQLCERADCGLLLDVTNLFINSRNHRFDPLEWLHEIEPNRIAQLHLAGYSRSGDRYTDNHSQAIQEELIELARAVIRYGAVEAITLERDDDFPATADLEREIEKLQNIRDDH